MDSRDWAGPVPIGLNVSRGLTPYMARWRVIGGAMSRDSVIREVEPVRGMRVTLVVLAASATDTQTD